MKPFPIIVFLFISVFVGCQLETNTTTDEDCENFTCTTDEPQFAEIKINFTRNAENPSPVIVVARGYWENHSIVKQIKTDTIAQYMNYVVTQVDLNSFYTVYTKYIKNNDTIVAIDGKLVFKDNYTECNLNCWEVKNTNFNIKLK